MLRHHRFQYFLPDALVETSPDQRLWNFPGAKAGDVGLLLVALHCRAHGAGDFIGRNGDLDGPRDLRIEGGPVLVGVIVASVIVLCLRVGGA